MSMHDTNKGFPLKKIQEFCALHPTDPIFRVQLAERYFELKHDIRAIYVARKAHALYLKENPKEAMYLVKRHGIEVDSRKTKFLGSGRYSALSDYFGMFNSSFKKVKFKEGSVVYRKGDISDCFYLVLDGELAAVHTTEDKHSLLSHFRQGDVLGEHDVQNIPFSEEYDEELSDEASKPIVQTNMYRGTPIVVDQKNEAEQTKKKHVTYRGATINPEKPKSNKSNKVMYRGAAVDSQENTESVRNVTILVQQDCILLKFTQSELEEALAKHPSLEKTFQEEQRIHKCLANISLSKLFLCLPPDLRFMIARRSKIITHKQGEALNTRGEFMSHVHLIVKGHVHLHESSQGDDLNYCGRLGLGDILGLEKILTKEPTNLMYKADVDCETLEISPIVVADILALSKQFRQLVEQYSIQSSTKTSRIMRLWNDENI